MHRSNFPFMRGWGLGRGPNFDQVKYEGVGWGRVKILVKPNLHIGWG